MASPSTSASASSLLPELQSALEEAPGDVNPYAYFAGEISRKVYPGMANWSKPVFLMFAILSFLNIIAALYVLWLKWRREGTVRLYKLSAHRSGSRFICLNSTNVFLVFHVISSAVFTVFPVVHCYGYKGLGKAHIDMSWTVLMWLAPYNGLLLTCFEALYALHVPPVAMTHRQPSGELVHSSGPLATLPCWLLNAIVIAAPFLVTASVMVPGLRAMFAVQYAESVAVDMTRTLLDASTIYDRNTVPPLEWQTSMLQQLARLSKYSEEAMHRWRPYIGVWAGWVAISALMALAASIAVYKVTKKRLRAAQRNFHIEEESRDSDNFQSPLPQETGHRGMMSADTLVRQHGRNSTPMTDPADCQRQQAAIQRARWDHYNLTTQFTMAAILFPIVEAFLLINFIVGYRILERIHLMAASLLVCVGAYVIQGSITVTLIIMRNIQANPILNPPPSSPRSTGLFRTGSGGRKNQSHGVVRVRADSEPRLSDRVVQVKFSQHKEVAMDGDESIMNVKYSPSLKEDTTANDSSYIDVESEKFGSDEDVKQENESVIEN